jgi:RHS repeat-associated protein
VDDVVLVAYDGKVTHVDLTAPGAKVAEATPTHDADGTRQASVVFPEGTTAEMVKPDGATTQLTTIDVRATEFTVGASGPRAMPGTLPPSSAYTYAAELSVDQAIAAGATEVRFSNAVINYVDNFRKFPVGGIVPTGYYDRATGAWKASRNGRVIKILSVELGKAEIDTDGDGIADDGLGIDDQERASLAQTRAPGAELWRVPMDHFTPWDHNWPYSPPDDAIQPNGPNPGNPNNPNPNNPSPDCTGKGSIIGCQSQSLAEELPIAGTPLHLRYDTRRGGDRRTDHSIEIPLTGRSVPASLMEVRLEVRVGGEDFEKTFAPQPNLAYTYVWDRKDAYGRTIQGRYPATIRIGFVYKMRYGSPSPANSAFSRPSDTVDRIGITPAYAGTVISWRTLRDEFAASTGSLDARGAGLGGWDLDIHHAYDERLRTLYRGDGGEVSAEPVLDALADPGDAGDPRDVDVAPDRSVWVANAATDQVLRFDSDGNKTIVAGSDGGGGGCENCLARIRDNTRAGDDPQAVGFPFSRPVAVALAPDGGFYVLDFLIDFGLSQGVVYRVDTDGSIHRAAGCICNAAFAEDVPALQASMNPTDIAVGADGTLYMADARYGRIRAVGPDGIIYTVAGGGDEATGYIEGQRGTKAHVFDPNAVEVGPDGEVYFGDRGHNGRVRRLDPDGTVTTVAGGVPYDIDDNGDGGPATHGSLFSPQGLSLAGDGSLYVADSERVRRVSPDAIITTVAGGGNTDADLADGVPAGSVRFAGAAGVDLAHDGSLYMASHSGLSRVSRPFPRTADGMLAIPSKDGREVYRFNGAGRHVSTLDGESGVAIWRFGYDDDGALSTVTDAADRVTHIERNANGIPIAIVAPGGQRTALELELDAQDRLKRVVEPGGADTQLGYDALRLATLTDRRGGHHEFVYDDDGRLIRDEDPTGKAQTLARVETETGFKVTLTSPEGRKRSWELGTQPDGTAFQHTTSPGGAVTTTTTGIDGVRRGSFPNGETVELTQAPDPRWGRYVPVTSRMVRTTPGGRTTVTTSTRAVTLTDETNPLSVSRITDTFTSNGRTFTIGWDAEQRQETTTTPEQRASVNTYDEHGRLTKYEPGPGVTPITYTYEGGLLTRSEQGDESYTWEHDAHDRPSARVDAAGHRTEFTYDDDGQVVAIKRPGGATERYEYNAAGGRSAVIMPHGQRHELNHDARDLFSGYTPAGGAKLERTHNDDKQLVSEGVADHETEHQYAPGSGRATGMSFADGTVDYGYGGGALEQPATIARTPAGGGPTEQDAFAFDGGLTTGLTTTGSAAGTFTYGYDDNRFLTSMKLVSGAQTVNTGLTRDQDGLLTGYGPFAITRGGVNGAASAITGGGLALALGRDGHGRTSSRALAGAGTQRYREELEWSADGRIARMTENVDGASHTYDYTYDADGQLTKVERDAGTGAAAVLERYGYDDNGNRTSRRLGSDADETATYDDQDRLVSRGATAYTFDAAGFMTARGDDRFDYSARGELLSATVGGVTVTYRYDGLGRRVARTQSGATTQYLYGNPGNPGQVTATRSAAGVLTTYYYDDDGLLFAIERGGAKFFVATDQVGSPRVVTNSSGVVQKVLDYDAFGDQVADSAPAFELPIGYAGGIDDRVTGLVRFGLRDLDTASGRWTARDPVLYEGGQANLYVYVGNDPVSLRDPLGLWCVGGSAYDGVGGGATICHTDEGTSVCFEVGFGVGVNIGVDNGGLAKDGESIVAEAKATVPFLGVTVGAELDNCGKVSSTGSADVGIVSVNVDEGTLQLQPPAIEEGLQAKLAAKVCRRLGK